MKKADGSASGLAVGEPRSLASPAQLRRLLARLGLAQLARMLVVLPAATRPLAEAALRGRLFQSRNSSVSKALYVRAEVEF